MEPQVVRVLVNDRHEFSCTVSGSLGLGRWAWADQLQLELDACGAGEFMRVITRLNEEHHDTEASCWDLHVMAKVPGMVTSANFTAGASSAHSPRTSYKFTSAT